MAREIERATASLCDDEVAELRRSNAGLQQRLDEALAERDEALRRETATAEVLQVINFSPGDLRPVFEVILEKAMHLCGFAFGTLWTCDGDSWRPMVHRGLPLRFAEFLEHDPPVPQPNPGTVSALVRAGESQPTLSRRPPANQADLNCS